MGRNTEMEQQDSQDKLIDNIDVLIFCEHCDFATTHEDLGKNGACPKCGLEIKELF